MSRVRVSTCETELLECTRCAKEVQLRVPLAEPRVAAQAWTARYNTFYDEATDTDDTRYCGLLVDFVFNVSLFELEWTFRDMLKCLSHHDICLRLQSSW
jgi:transposase